ncbi:MAG: DUF4835 family protein [Bacteroidaceae bacterium]|nr:DUF4835 family protein [Bacteroidaceae bacterium]
MRRLQLFLLLCGLVSFSVSAQELNAKVSVNTSKVSNTKTEVFTALQEKVQAFLNDHRWTGLNFKELERIECSFNITVNEWKEDDQSMKCVLMLTSNRPVFNSSYSTPLYNVKDPTFNFNFQTTDQLEWNPEYVDNNLTALLAYYAYMIIGYDLDSMGPLAGTEVFQMAEDVVTKAQNLGSEGWSSFNDSQNRFGLLNDYLDGSMESYRQLIYQYHRKGLDQMADNSNEGRTAISEAMELLDEAKGARAMSQLPVLFTETKRDELVNIYQGHGESAERERVADILAGINATMIKYWDKIRN